MRAEGFVFGHQVVEWDVGFFVEAHDGEVLFEAADDVAGLIGEGEELFGGEVESLVMAEANEIDDGQNGDDGESQNRGVVPCCAQRPENNLTMARKPRMMAASTSTPPAISSTLLVVSSSL